MGAKKEFKKKCAGLLLASRNSPSLRLILSLPLSFAASGKGHCLSLPPPAAATIEGQRLSV